MTDPQPAEATVTIASQTIELLLTGKPDVPYKWGSGSIRPGLVILTYRQDGIHAHLYGAWVREDGQLTDQPCDQQYRVDDTDWPDWLTEMAREHHPNSVRTAILEEAAQALTGRHCSPESVAVIRHLIDKRLCTECDGYGQTVTKTPDGGIVRRCRPCNGEGLVR